MIAVNLNRKRIAFMPGITDGKKRELIIQMWLINDWYKDYNLPPLHKYMDLTKDSDHMVDDVVYFS